VRLQSLPPCCSGQELLDAEVKARRELERQIEAARTEVDRLKGQVDTAASEIAKGNHIIERLQVLTHSLQYASLPLLAAQVHYSWMHTPGFVTYRASCLQLPGI
jgi:hypothetical protein